MKILFVCNQARHRSRTAAEMYAKDYDTLYRGLYSENPIAREDVIWADIIVVMEPFQRTDLSKRFPDLYLQKTIYCLDIADVYSYNDPTLKRLLKDKLASLLHPEIELP